MIINDLFNFYRIGAVKRGIKKMKDDPTMLLITKEERSDILDDPTISMKTNNLFY